MRNISRKKIPFAYLKSITEFCKSTDFCINRMSKEPLFKGYESLVLEFEHNSIDYVFYVEKKHGKLINKKISKKIK